MNRIISIEIYSEHQRIVFKIQGVRFGRLEYLGQKRSAIFKAFLICTKGCHPQACYIYIYIYLYIDVCVCVRARVCETPSNIVATI